MTTPLVDMVVAPVAADLLACLMTEMARTPTPPAQVCIRVGDRVDLLLSETYDECCAGTAWVRFARQYPSTNFPDMDEGKSPCDAKRWALVFELGAAHCGPVAGPGEVPSCEAWTQVAVTHFAYLAALRRTACCYTNDHRRDRKVLVVEGTPQTTEGGCTSVTLQLMISALGCDLVCSDRST
jgi:hypothetical protein